MYYKDALGAILVYDITFKESFSKMQKWLLELKEFAHKRIVLCIAGNKCDMVQQRQVDLKDAEAFAKQNNAKHFSTSAKANIGISEMFQYLVTEIDVQHGKKIKPKGSGIILGQPA